MEYLDDIVITKKVENTERNLLDGLYVYLEIEYDPFDCTANYNVVVLKEENVIGKSKIYDAYDEIGFSKEGKIVPGLEKRVLDLYNTLVS